LRRTDFLARYGGEEFGIIAPQTALEAAKVLAERLRRAIARERAGRRSADCLRRRALCRSDWVCLSY
jgi:diguanylate cyclase (GGDEF)-like protein